MNISQIPFEERPREKLIEHGPESLSLAELLAILLRTGMQGEDVVTMSQNLLSRMGGLEGMAKASTAELMQERGLKAAKAASLAAALELGKRMVLLKETDSGSWEKRLYALAFEAKYKERESIHAIYLGVKDNFLGESELSYGGPSGAFLDLPVFFRQAVRMGASKVVMLHNHPDGSRNASKEDMELTEYVKKALRYLGIELKAHYIAADGGLYPISLQPAREYGGSAGCCAQSC